MTRKLNYLLVIIASSVLLAGCCSAGHSNHWEYKVASPGGSQQNLGKVIEPFLNEMAKDGWIFIQRDEVGHFYFKRVKR
jgi:hypothetical protein